MFTDTHCHISKEYYENIDVIIENAQSNGITKMINNGTNLTNNKEVLALCQNYRCMYASIGFHPEDIATFKEEDLTIIEENIDKIVAIGEIGLDYHYLPCNKEKQKELLIKQLSIAEKYNKPVIIHTRDAFQDTIDILQRFPKVCGVIHCFTGTLKEAQEYLKLGFKLGIGGILTFKNSNLKEIIDKLPLTSFTLETDSPYLAPVPLRGKLNEPANIRYIAEFITTIKHITMEELSKITEENVRNIFDI